MATPSIPPEVAKANLIESLKDPTKRQEFMEKFEGTLANHRKLLYARTDFLVNYTIEDMKKTADTIREKLPDIATFIDQLRAKVEALFEERDQIQSSS